MHVRKRNGRAGAGGCEQDRARGAAVAHGLTHVDAIRVASKTIGGLYDGATTRELDAISIDTAASLIAEEPQYSRLAARLLLATIVKEVSALNLHSFSQAIAYGHAGGRGEQGDGGVCADACAQAESRDRR